MRRPDPNSRAFLHLDPGAIADRAAQQLVDAGATLRRHGRPDPQLSDEENAACAEEARAARRRLAEEVLAIGEALVAEVAEEERVAGEAGAAAVGQAA